VRTLLTPRWLGLLAAALALATTMVFLGLWQLDRYHQRTAINDRIAAGESGAAEPVGSVLPAAGVPAPEAAQWRRVTATGAYDAAHELLVRGRTADGQVGFEVITPLVLDDGSAVLVDRGWVPPSPGGPTVAPAVPAAPSGTVTVTARVHPTESGALDSVVIGGRTEVRRVNIGALGGHLGPYAIHDAYLLAVAGTPGATGATIDVAAQNAWQNAAYVVQWWLFAGLTLYGFFYLLRKEHQLGPRPKDPASTTPREAAQVA
jgi:cytochrome oxidase assembly protein ShyY1